MIKTKKRLLSLGLAVLMLLTAVMFVIPAADVRAAWSDNAAADFAAGKGTEAEPYQISNAEELALMAVNVNKGVGRKAFYELTADIDISGAEWTAIGTADSPFEGTFDGNGRTISGIYINKPDEDYQGLFGYCIDAYISNVGIEGGSITGKEYAGGVCGYIVPNRGDANIEKCYNTGKVSGKKNIGGICGFEGASKMKNCYNTGTISGNENVGGICGSFDMCFEITNCLNISEVIGKTNVGGIYGYYGPYDSSNDFKYCYYSTDLCKNKEQEGITGLSTEELCKTLPEGFDSSIWVTGSAVRSVNGRYNDENYEFPYLKNVGKQQKTSLSLFNFGNDVNEDWQTYKEITTAEELQNINNDLSGNYVLMNDIDASVLSMTAEGNWTAIGTEKDPFKGRFDGNGKTVSGIVINKPNTDHQGLFGYSDGGSIKNVSVINSSISAHSYAGGICGRDVNGTIELCQSSADVTAKQYAGGICGTIKNSKIKKCLNTGNVAVAHQFRESAYCAGGICGYIFDEALIENCFNSGRINAIKWVGGIVGKSYNGKTVNCINIGEVCGEEQFGGVCGASDSGTISSCYYSSDTCTAGGIDENDTTEAMGLPADKLCQITALGFDSSIWTDGGADGTVISGNDARFGRQQYKLPYITALGEESQQKISAFMYNKNADALSGNDDWAGYVRVTNAKQLQSINLAFDGNYVLMNDIDVSVLPTTAEGNWTAIGDSSDPFSGIFDGNGHVVSGININKPNEEFQGLFGNSEGVIKNVGIENSSIIGEVQVGGICGSNEGTIEGCYNTGDIKATSDRIGGICGHNNGANAKIKNCYNTGTLDGYLSGGICGANMDGSISDCYNAGKVVGYSAGAICATSASINSTANVTNCYYSKDICSVIGVAISNCRVQAKGITTEELCDILSRNFDSNVWANGTVNVSENGVFRETSFVLPYLKNVGNQQTVTFKYYNFGIDGKDDWDNYTAISTADELQAINTDDTTRSGNYVLMNDIVIPAGENNFTAIGNDNNTAFTGKFSGNGHTVSGININKTENNPEPYGLYLGLFGYSNGLIMNVNVADSSIIGIKYTGAVCGFNDGGTVWGCSGSGSIKCTEISAGGVCGYNQGGYISKCYNTGDVSGPHFVGGICGYNYTTDNPIRIAKITDCYNMGTVTASDDNSIAGGVCSYNSNNVNSTIDNCYSAGSLICTGENSEADGICYNLGTVTNCYYNTDFCEFESSCGTGLTTLKMVSGKMAGFDPSVWTYKSVDKTAKTAYYPALVVFGNGNPIGYETKLDITLTAGSETVYGGDYSFDISALVKFDGMTEFRADKTALTTGCGKYTVVCGDKTLCTGDIYDNTIVTATYSGKDIPRGDQTINLNYDGTGSEFLVNEAASLNAEVTHTHTLPEEYENDDTEHWKTCSVCDDKVDLEKHSFDEGVITTEPTEETTGVKTYTCIVCGYTKTETVSKLDHTHKPSETYSYDETNHWKTCSGCDERLDLENHSFDSGVITTEPTETTAGVKTFTCEVCGYTKTETIPELDHTHKPSEDYFYDEINHWKTCSGCDEKLDLENHSFDEGVITTESTEETTGIKTFTCEVCGYAKTETIPELGHTHKPSEKYSYDETNHWKTCSGCDERLDLENHSFDEGIVTVEPTKSAEGERTYTCTVCGYEKTEGIDKLPDGKTEKKIYPIVISGEVSVDKSGAGAGETVNVSAPFGYDIIVSDASGRQIAKFTEKGSFKMPASGVVITAVRGEIFAHMTNAWKHSYVYSYDSDMNRIKVSSDVKRGVIAIDLGDDYAGRSFTIYSGRKSTSKKITEGVLDKNGRFTFSADEGRNYTLVLD